MRTKERLIEVLASIPDNKPNDKFVSTARISIWVLEGGGLHPASWKDYRERLRWWAAKGPSPHFRELAREVWHYLPDRRRSVRDDDA